MTVCELLLALNEFALSSKPSCCKLLTVVYVPLDHLATLIEIDAGEAVVAFLSAYINKFAEGTILYTSCPLDLTTLNSLEIYVPLYEAVHVISTASFVIVANENLAPVSLLCLVPPSEGAMFHVNVA